MKVYLDACCLARLTDDQAQARIRDEAAAIDRIFAALDRGDIQWVSSAPLAEEIAQNPSLRRRAETAALLAWASEAIDVDESIASRARQLQSIGYGAYDALHLAAAESAHADILLTTDDRFLKRAARGDGNPLVRVDNPLSWEKECSS